ncbi:TPA: NUDIX domain-containing protein [Candidatus Saccharibacteria bacterium]|nr:NUDIX domain-containing protein [Candidatus Saccharibacteria bacterium]HIO87640.1 NUDIX domain-containing protein [Candidatus Saccharibacteria bacterium]
MSLIQIVDENDNLIGHKERSEVDYSKDIYRITALWLTNSSNQVLLAQRKHTKEKDPGLWGPAMAGTLDEGETYDENAYKEVDEEIGLKNETLTKEQKEYVESPRKYFLQWFSLVLDKPIDYFTVQEDEVEQVKWIDAKELAKDIQENPQNYVPSMPRVLDTFLKEYT